MLNTLYQIGLRIGHEALVLCVIQVDHHLNNVRVLLHCLHAHEVGIRVCRDWPLRYRYFRIAVKKLTDAVHHAAMARLSFEVRIANLVV